MTERFRLAAAIPLLCSTLALTGCGTGAPKSSTPPARVANPVKEADLTTVTLTPEAEKRLGIETAVIELRDVGAHRQAAGDVVAPPGRVVPLTAPTAGRVDSPPGGPVPVGARVTSGQAVLRLTPLATPPRDLRVTYEADAKAAAARLEAARQQLDRARQLLRDRAGSQRDAERAEQEFAQAKAAADAANERLARLADRPLDGDVAVPVIAPFDGILSQVHVGSGQMVPAGAALVEVADLSTMQVRVPVYPGDLAALESVREIAVDDLRAAPSAARFTARRVTGPRAADPLAVSADLYFEFDNRALALRPGQKVGVSLPSGVSGRTLTVPDSAVVYDFQGGAWVYVNTGPHVYVRQRVDVVRTVGRDIVLGRGPAAGARVVVAGVVELFGTEFGAGK
jgi:membrane fusion protein, heavy metal efflux system